MDGGIPNSTEATNSRVHTWVSKPFPIRIFINYGLFSMLWTDKNDFNADPFNLDPKAARRAVSIGV